jgi:hypothetical protein
MDYIQYLSLFLVGRFPCSVLHSLNSSSEVKQRWHLTRNLRTHLTRSPDPECNNHELTEGCLVIFSAHKYVAYLSALENGALALRRAHRTIYLTIDDKQNLHSKYMPHLIWHRKLEIWVKVSVGSSAGNREIFEIMHWYSIILTEIYERRKRASRPWWSRVPIEGRDSVAHGFRESRI